VSAWAWGGGSLAFGIAVGIAVGILAGIVAVLARWLRGHLVRVVISGRSMRPTFDHGDRVLARRVRATRIQASDIIVMESPAGSFEHVQAYLDAWRPTYEVAERDRPVLPDHPTERRWAIKRVVATAGDPVPFPIPQHADDVVVPSGSIVVLGDNAEESFDSRHHGYVAVDRVLGKVV
jgi:signal peptidase I